MARIAVLAFVAMTIATPPAPAAQSLTTGFVDPVFSDADRALAGQWFDRAVEAQAGIVRLDVPWSTFARPQNATDPADPSYTWRRTDAAVRDATARGLRVFLSFTGAPPWAEGPDRPRSAAPGAWRPDPRALADFGTALATRYSGTYADPEAPGAALPAVRWYQPWNEPNLPTYLEPQWTEKRGRQVPASPGIYRDLLNAFAASVKRVDRRNRVVTAGTAPFGDPEPGGRIPPVQFLRRLLSQRVDADALAHHPYSVRGPRSPALNRDDVSVADLGKVRRVLKQAARRGRLARRQPRLWVTELSWDSSPPDPDGVPSARHARWVAQSLQALAESGVDTVVWYLIRDQAEGASFAATSQSGMWLRNGEKKPSLQAFAFPLVTDSTSRSRVRVWVRAPLAGKLIVETRNNGRWNQRHIAALDRHETFELVLRARQRTLVRARIGSLSSMESRAR